MKLAYTGSFDPFTNGHLHIVDKATLFESVEKIAIIVANNPGKKHHFSAEDRVEMIKKTLFDRGRSDDSRYEVCILPPNQYAVSYAKEIGCDAMLRGVRTEQDFQDECGLYQANKLIDKRMETIYMMPDINLSAVRSSLVMGLVGPAGWTSAVGELVPPAVMMAVCKKFCMAKCGIGELDGDWSAYERPYHNWEHIAYCLTEFIRLAGPSFTFEMLGILMHDIIHFDSMTDLFTKPWFAGSQDMLLRQTVYDTIMATNHEKPRDMGDDKFGLLSLVHDIDLSVLAWREDKYDRYTRQIFDEYVNVLGVPAGKFREGRMNFLNAMLWKKIFLLNHYDEAAAKRNIERELVCLGDD